MSRAYQVRVAETLTHHTRVEDGIQARLELLGVLGPDRTAELLAEELGNRGYEIGEDRIARKTVELGDNQGSVEVEIDTRDGTVTVRARGEGTAELSATRSQSTWDERAATVREQLEAHVRRELAEKAAKLDEAERERVSARLDRALAEIKPELDAVTDAVTRAALRERAGQMGEIIEVSENAAGEMTIRVRV